MDEYKFGRLPKNRSVSSVDDLYHVLFYHWVHDDVAFRDEQQWNYVPAGILTASYFGCPPVSMFDTESRFVEKGDARKLFGHVTATSKLKSNGEDLEIPGTKNSMDWDDDQPMLVNSDGELASDVDGSTSWDSDSDSGTDDSVDAGLNETRSLL